MGCLSVMERVRRMGCILVEHVVNDARVRKCVRCCELVSDEQGRFGFIRTEQDPNNNDIEYTPRFAHPHIVAPTLLAIDHGVYQARNGRVPCLSESHA